MFSKLNDLLEAIYIMWKTNLTIYCTVLSGQNFSSFTFCGIFKWMFINQIPLSIVWLKHSILDHNPLKVVQWRCLDILVVFCEIGFRINSYFFQPFNELLEYDQYSKIKVIIITKLLSIGHHPVTSSVINPLLSIPIDFIHCSAWLLKGDFKFYLNLAVCL